MIFSRLKIKYIRILTAFMAAVLISCTLYSVKAGTVDRLKGDEHTFAPAILQTNAASAPQDKKTETNRPSAEFQYISNIHSNRIKIRSCLIQLNNEQSLDQKYYPFLTSYFSTGT